MPNGAVCDITCLTDEGAGRDLPIEVFIYKDAAADVLAGGVNCTRCKSAVFQTQAVNYAAPLISEYQGTGADLTANTVGGEPLIIKGANFGPPCSPNCPLILSALLVEIEDDDSSNGDGNRRRLTAAAGLEKVYKMDHTSCVVFSCS